MRRHPSTWFLPDAPLAPIPVRSRYLPEPGQRFERPQSMGDRVRPFYVSGGSCGFLVSSPQSDFYTAAESGAQLVSSVYVPPGSTGFIKDIRIAPFKPSFLAPGISGGGGVVEMVTSPDGIKPNPIVDVGPDSNQGFWNTPFAWECYLATGGEVEPPPTRWQWHLRLITGRLQDARRNLGIPPFSFADPLSWYLVPDIAVPFGTTAVPSAYPAGLPGSTPGEPWGRQRLQRVGWFENPLHVLIPENTTACLFATWNQSAYPYKTANLSPLNVVSNSQDGFFFPLLPSFGQMSGYTQPSNRAATQHNALSWGG